MRPLLILNFCVRGWEQMNYHYKMYMYKEYIEKPVHFDHMQNITRLYIARVPVTFDVVKEVRWGFKSPNI